MSDSLEGGSVANVDAFEIEITPAMIKAGVAVYPAFDSRFETTYDDAVVEIFEAMWVARAEADSSTKKGAREVG